MGVTNDSIYILKNWPNQKITIRYELKNNPKYMYKETEIKYRPENGPITVKVLNVGYANQ